MLAWVLNLGFAASGVSGATDFRTVTGRAIIPFDSGDKFRMTAFQTEGASDLETSDEGQGLNARVFD